MSATTSIASTVQERSANATRRLRMALGLDDLKLLSAAVAEVAAEEAVTSAAFAHKLRATYKDLESLKQARRSQTTTRTILELVPIGEVEPRMIDPYAPLDPNYLLRLYGISQFRAALDGFSRDTLKEAAAKIELAHPGTKPTNKSRKDSIIAYIVEHVAGPGY